MAVWWLPLFQLSARQVAADSHVSSFACPIRNSANRITADWGDNSSDRWTIPIDMLLSRMTVCNRQPMNLGDRVLPQRCGLDSALPTTLGFAVGFIFPDQTDPNGKALKVSGRVYLSRCCNYLQF